MSHILLTGGGTLGPVTPLLAVAEAWRKEEPGVKLSWVGTPDGPEEPLVTAAKIPFQAFRAPKFDRTRPWRWPFLPFQIVKSLKQAFAVIDAQKPDAVLSAGAYVSVPLAFAAWKRGIPVWIHQLDVVPGLANKLMAPFAAGISVTFPESFSSFLKKKTYLFGAMARPGLAFGNADVARRRYGLRPNVPTILFVGGGTGAQSLNDAAAVIAPELAAMANVIHLVGKGKMPKAFQNPPEHYIPLEFLGEGFADALAVADIVVARAGLGTIAELVALQKASILVPMPNSHQEKNAAAVAKQGACDVLINVTPQNLLQSIKSLLRDPARQDAYRIAIGNLFPLDADIHIVKAVQAILATRMR